MPTIRISRYETPSPKFRSAGAPPAPGSVPSSGVPATSGPAGNIAFESHILIAGPTANINRGAFPGRLTETIRELVPGATANAADIVISSSPSTGGTAEIASIAAGWFTTSPGATWVTIRGAMAATRTWTLSTLNRAIARAFANNVTWSNMPSGNNSAKPPSNDPGGGGLLLAALDASNACAGRAEYGKLYAKACTRWGTMAASPAVTPQTPAVPGPVMTPTTQGTIPTLCTVTTRSMFWLRPTATFAQQGPSLPAGTVVDIKDVTTLTSGTGASQLRLYKVSVAATQSVAAARPYIGQGGFAAMSASDVSACAARIAAAVGQQGTLQPYGERPPSVTPPPAPVTPTPTPGTTGTAIQRPPVQTTVRQESGGGQGMVLPPMQTGMSTGTKVAIGVGGALVLSGIGVVIWKSSQKKSGKRSDGLSRDTRVS